MTTATPVGYLYRDEYYCTGCIAEQVDAGLLEWKQRNGSEYILDVLASLIGVDRKQEHSFSQCDFPHTITSGQLDEPVRCDTCMEEIR